MKKRKKVRGRVLMVRGGVSIETRRAWEGGGGWTGMVGWHRTWER